MGYYDDIDDTIEYCFSNCYDDYEVTTKDPGTLFFWITSLYIVLILALTFPLVWLGRKFKKARKQWKVHRLQGKTEVEEDAAKVEEDAPKQFPFSQVDDVVDSYSDDIELALLDTIIYDTYAISPEPAVYTIEIPKTSIYQVKILSKKKLAFSAGKSERRRPKITKNHLPAIDTDVLCGDTQIVYEMYEDDEDGNCKVESEKDDENGLGTGDVTRGVETLKHLFALDKETGKIMQLAIPGTFSCISGSFLSAITTAMVSWNIGPTGYVAYCMVGVIVGISDTFIGGVEGAESVLTAQAIGRKNYFMAGQYCQLTTLLYMIISFPIYLLEIFIIGDILMFMGLGEDVAMAARAYAPICVLSYMVNGLSDCFGTLLWSAGYGVELTVLDTIFHVLYVLVLHLVFTNAAYSDLITIGWIGVIYGVVYGATIYTYFIWSGKLELYRKGLFRNSALKNAKLIRGVLQMAVPMSIGSLLAYGEWEMMTFFAAYMGEAEVAAWALAGAIWELFEYLPAGISDATEIRVGYHLGNGDPMMAKITAYKCLAFALVWVSIVTAVFVFYSEQIIIMFTGDDTLQNMLRKIVALISVGNIIMCIGSEAYYIITAQRKAKLATKISFFSSWGIAIPMSFCLVLMYNYGLQALVMSLVASYATTSFTLLYVVFTSNWVKISKKIIKKIDEESKESLVQETEMPEMEDDCAVISKEFT